MRDLYVSHRGGRITDIDDANTIGGTERDKKIEQCLLDLGPNADDNIQQMTALCGELFGAASALYNRLREGMLYSLGQWQTPPDYNPVDKPDGHICYDVIRDDEDTMLLIRDLQQSHYSVTDINVSLYKLKTYIGQAVKCYGEPVGSLCAVFVDDFQPSADDRRIMNILAKAIGQQEESKKEPPIPKEPEPE